MKALTAEWVEKAEGDFHSCLREAGLAFPKTHDLLDLLNRLLTVEPAWTALNPQLTQLVNYAVVFRYPGISASKADARIALVACRARKE